MVSGTLALLHTVFGLKLGCRGDFPSVRPSVDPSVRASVTPLEGPRASQAGLRPSQSGLRASQAGLRASQVGLLQPNLNPKTV